MDGTGADLVGEIRKTQKDKHPMLPPSGNNDKTLTRLPENRRWTDREEKGGLKKAGR